MSELDRFLEGDGEEGFNGLRLLMESGDWRGYQAAEADLRKVISWQYCPYCLAEDGLPMPANPSGIEGNRWAYYEGDNRYKCSWCGGIFERKEVRRIGGGRAMGKTSLWLEQIRDRAEELAPRPSPEGLGVFDRGTKAGIDATINAVMEIALKRRRRQMQEMYLVYEVECQVNDRICGGIPKEGEMIKAWVEAKTGFDDERADKIIEETTAQVATEEIEEEKEKRSWNCFKRDETGLYIESRQVKALLKECANILKGTKGAKPIIDIRNLKHKLAERVFVEPPRIYLGRGAPDGHIERGIHVWTAQGPRDAIKRADYVLNPHLQFHLRVLNDGLITEDVLRKVLHHGELIGIGADRSQGYGKYQLLRLELQTLPK